MPIRDWGGPAYEAKVRAEERKRLARAAQLVAGHARVLLNVSGTGGIRGSKRGYGSNPSSPGEPPRKQTGRLRMGVTWEPSEVAGLPAVRVGPSGFSALYGKFLELGTRRMAARPWLVRAFREKREQVRAILTAPIR